MAIVRMKRVRLLALEKDRDFLLDKLQKLGCVQIDSQTARLDDPEWAGLVNPPKTELAKAKEMSALLSQALDTLSTCAGIKNSMIGSLFNARPQMTVDQLLEEGFLSEMLDAATEITEQAKNISALTAERGRLENRMAALSPWCDMDVPLDFSGSSALDVIFGVCPTTADADSIVKTMDDQGEACQVFVIGSDSDQIYLEVLMHPSSADVAGTILKSFGFSRMVFKDVTGTAANNIADFKAQMAELDSRRDAAKAGLIDFAPRRADLRQAYDAVQVRLQREEAAGLTLSTGQSVFMEGWAPESVIEPLEKFFAQHDCAYETAVPGEDDDVPVLLHSGKLTQPFSMVTEMYALPKYTNIDPNPLMAPFYALFFGMMFADVGYGLVLFFLGLAVTKKGRPAGMMGNAFKLMMICGVSTVICGLMTGGFFSNSISVIAETFFNTPDVALPALIDPLSEPLLMLGISLVLGVVHIIVGMAIKMYLLFRDGHPVAACLEVLPWWFLFTAIALLGLNMTGIISFAYGVEMLIAGFVLIVLTQGYAKKGIFKKLFGGIAALYNATAYLSDILSYSRIMALGLAGGVIGMVFNTLGAMPGSMAFVPLGVLLFAVIFVAGHIFNIGVSVIGTYVHAARLQYIEYFSKFYESDGKPFVPLRLKTKYTEIISPEFSRKGKKSRA